MGMNIGAYPVDNVMLGGQKVEKIMMGTQEVWANQSLQSESTPSETQLDGES